MQWDFCHQNDSIKEKKKESDHGIEFCSECSKGFNTMTVLKKHMYLYKELKLMCELCRQGFPFKSHLKTTEDDSQTRGNTPMYSQKLQ